MKKDRIEAVVKEAAKKVWQSEANKCWQIANDNLSAGCVLTVGNFGEDAFCWLKKAARLNVGRIELSTTEKEAVKKIAKEALTLSHAGGDVSCLQKFFEIAKEIL